MSDSDKDLILYLPLDESYNDGTVFKFRDRSGRNHDGEIKGNVSLVTDDIFGACASFDGKDSFIQVADSPDLQITGDITVEAWVYLSAAPADWVRIVGKGPSDKRNYGLWYSQNVWMFQRHQDCGNSQAVSLNAWYHLSGTLQASRALLYLHDLKGNRILDKEATWSGPPPTSNAPLTIGFAGFHGAHTGKIAGVRVYGRALSQAEIERDISADRLYLVAFRKSHPIDFRLYDDDDQAVLYISDDPDGHNLNLELHNTSTQTIQLATGKDTAASETNHHFALRFRPGTLSESTIKFLVIAEERAKILNQADADEWNLYFPAQAPAANQPALLYLLYKGPSESFQPDERRRLKLQRMSAAPGSGSRGTRAELIPSKLKVVGDDSAPITGSRAQYVHITNQSGRKNIPLHVSFVGGNTVLNDGSASTNLLLRITNVLRKGDITLTPGTGKRPSKFIISFDAQLVSERDGKTPVEPLKDWALVTTTDAKNITVEIDGGVVRPEGTQGETPEWPITFAKESKLAAGEHLQIEINGIVSQLPSGQANLYVRYENIPGYWDGQFVCTIEKGPLVVRDFKGRHWVGIGTLNPQTLLQVGRGTSRIDENQVNALIATDTPDAGIAIAQRDNVNVVLQASAEGGFIGTSSNHPLALGTSGADRVSIDQDGNVEVHGPLTANKFTGEGALLTGMIVMWSGDKIPRGWALCDGSPGTPDLRDRFILGTGDSFESPSDKNRFGGQSSHTHKMGEAGRHSHDLIGKGGAGLTIKTGNSTIDDAPGHVHDLGETFVLPPYYKVAFIIKL